MNEKSYRSLLNYAKYKIKHTEEAEDILHDSIVTALEKKQNKSSFIARTFDYHRRTFFRDSKIKLKNETFYYVDETLTPETRVISGEALDITKAIKVLTENVKKKFSYRKKSKRVEAFIRFYLWKENAKDIAKDLKSTAGSIRNVSYDTAKKLAEDKKLLPYLEILSPKNYNRTITNTTRKGVSKRLRNLKNKK